MQKDSARRSAKQMGQGAPVELDIGSRTRLHPHSHGLFAAKASYSPDGRKTVIQSGGRIRVAETQALAYRTPGGWFRACTT